MPDKPKLDEEQNKKLADLTDPRPDTQSADTEPVQPPPAEGEGDDGGPIGVIIHGKKEGER